MEWDEVIHLNGALYLHSGLYSTFVNNAFYPPLFDGIATISFNIFGISLSSARLVSALFSILSLGVVFELAYKMYGGKTALLSSGSVGHNARLLLALPHGAAGNYASLLCHLGAFLLFSLVAKQERQVFGFGWFSGWFRGFN